MSAGLFGIKNSNRDFAQPSSWGKNQFNSAFPVALLCYFQHKGIECVYLTSQKDGSIAQSSISPNDVLGIKYDDPDVFFLFESSFSAYQEVLVGRPPAIDLVAAKKVKGGKLKELRGLEIKLTAVPDNTTSSLSEEYFGPEMVFRQPTIAYLASNLALHFRNKRAELRNIYGRKLDDIKDWANPNDVLLSLVQIYETLNEICERLHASQIPLLVQPIWKTRGTSSILCDDCLDVFVWSDLAFTRLILDRITEKIKSAASVDRPIRSAIWLTKMLYDFNQTGRMNHASILDQLSYGPKNDKAFAVSGKVTHRFLNSPYLTRPRIRKNEITNIVLGDGFRYLSPERRFDAAIAHDAELFSRRS